MEGPITDSAREAMLQAALSRVDAATRARTLRAATDPRLPVSTPIANVLAALRKHRDPRLGSGPGPVPGGPAVRGRRLAEPCLAAVIEALGDAADDPTREQLFEADRRGGRRLRRRDPGRDAGLGGGRRHGRLRPVLHGPRHRCALRPDRLAARSAPGAGGPAGSEPVAARPGASAEQRAARRAKKQRDAEERRHRAEAAARAAERVRQARKKERGGGRTPPGYGARASGRPASVAPSLGRRRVVLTPLEEEEFDRDDPWSAGVVLAWSGSTRWTRTSRGSRASSGPAS